MIISYSNNFVVIRSPKTGSTSLVFYFFKSGLIDPEQDRYNIEKPFATWEEMEKEYKGHGLKRRIKRNSTTYVSSLPNIPSYFAELHSSFEELRRKGLVDLTMSCVGTIRNPITRVASMYNYPKFFGRANIKNNPNKYWDDLKNKFKPQCDYFPDHAELFNTENLHEHVSKYILEKGGRVDRRIEMRKNPDNKLDVFLAELTPNRKQDILDTYAKDFELWEKAYTVYN